MNHKKLQLRDSLYSGQAPYDLKMTWTSNADGVICESAVGEWIPPVKDSAKC
ncbi:hypothetical protein TIFTF001_029967 [Ficus carica]|uniref:Uncharacterized protein n=1 Tax=Ficus carica TaxID=3494 RepID=A0AA88DSE5_FICCA|nr:hypothetical protein TIFTF001_029967 [Ficus carica]